MSRSQSTDLALNANRLQRDWLPKLIKLIPRQIHAVVQNSADFNRSVVKQSIHQKMPGLVRHPHF